MKLHFTGDLDGLSKGLEILSKTFNFEVSDNGINVSVEKRPGAVEVSTFNNTVKIGYEEKVHFFRALGQMIQGLRKGAEFSIKEEPQFTMNGVMLDVSRNAVMKVSAIKKYIDSMAIMGLNMIMLYAEDTYEVKDYPYFGYMRGRYTEAELKEVDDYADIFGIEIIPCIQTLAHLNTAIKWSYANEFKDTEDILLVGNEKTYEFIESMIVSASKPFRSKRIHVGMDEAHNLGLGKYLDLHGYTRRFDIMNEHLERVKSIANSHGLKPMMWSDMYFRLGSETGNYYDTKAVIPQDVIEKIPKGVDLVYWDYYHNEKQTYEDMIHIHKKMASNTVFAGGIWTWSGIAINYVKTFNNTNAGLAACKEQGVKEVFATMWGDNGAETDYFTALLGLQLFAEHGYSKEVDIENLKERFEFCTGASYDAFMDLGRFDEVYQDDKFETNESNPSKYILWQDVLIGLFDKNLEGKGLSNYYESLYNKLLNDQSNSGDLYEMFDTYVKLAKVLSVKSEIGIRIKSMYDAKNKDSLANLASKELTDLYNDVYLLKEAHKKSWFNINKPFGWEIIDMRYGGLLSRLETARQRILDYVNGTIDKIEELEEERLYFDGPVRPKNSLIGACNVYHKIVSASPFYNV